MAVRVDEMDLERLPVEDQEQQRREHEEVHLMFRANQLVRQHLPREGSERARRIQVIMESLRNQIGSEDRHVQGARLRMITRDCGRAPSSRRARRLRDF